jgi:hypothetical protein
VEEVRDLAARLACGKESADAVIDRLAARTWAFFRTPPNLAALHGLAGALLKRHTIGGSRARQIIRDWRAAAQERGLGV